MIELSPLSAITLYLLLTLAILLGLWITHHYRFRFKKILPSDQSLLICEYCHFAYLGEANSSVTRCPQCQSFNKNNYFKK